MSIHDEQQRWNNDTLKPTLERFPERKLNFSTSSGISLPTVLIPSDSDPDYMEKLGFPGEFPFTRGVQATMYRGRFWTMRQYAGFGNAEETNQRFHYLLKQGQNGLSVAFDLPTQIGYDADDPLALGEVGKVGVSISSLEDMEVLFHDIPLDQVSTSMTINAPAAILLAMYIAVAKRQGMDISRLRGTVQNDILKEYVARGTYIFPPQPSMKLVTDVMGYCHQELPHWNTISISGYHIREAGSNAVQEVAFTLGNAVAYVQAAIDSGLDVDEFAGQISFFFNAHNNFFEEIAKFRAARRIWAHLMRDRYKAQKPASWMLRFHTQTGGSTLTAQQPENNVPRVTLQALAAILGGTQSLHTNSMDEALWLPTEKSVMVALRTQQVLAYETGVADVVDPLAGSYQIEHLTDEIEKRALDYIERIESLGGAIAAIQKGYIQQEIQDNAYKIQRALEDGDEVIVGMNAYQVDEDIVLKPIQVDPSIREIQQQHLAALRDRRDTYRISELLTHLEIIAKENENLIPLFITLVENDCTLGEICQVLRRVWGEYHPTTFI